MRNIFISIFVIINFAIVHAQYDIALVEKIYLYAQENGNTVLKDFYCKLQKDPKLVESNTITLRRGQEYVFYFMGSKINETDAEIKIFAPNNKQSFSKAIVNKNEIDELRLISTITQNFIIEITKPNAGKFEALVLVTLKGN